MLGLLLILFSGEFSERVVDVVVWCVKFVYIFGLLFVVLLEGFSRFVGIFVNILGLLLILLLLLLFGFILAAKSDGGKVGVKWLLPKVLKLEIAVLTKSDSFVNGLEEIWISSSYKSGMEKLLCKVYELLS